MKVCHKCQEQKEESEFYPHRAKCKTCFGLMGHQYRAKHTQETKEYARKYRQTNATKIKTYHAGLTAQGYYRQHYAEGYRDNRLKYYQENKPQILIKRKKLTQTPEYKKARCAYMQMKRDTDPHYKIRLNIFRRVRDVLKGQSKSASTLALLGCDIKTLKNYLEQRFQKGMSWENYGMFGWHIDHIKPCASFDLTKEAEQRICFHYTNLQPLWARENLVKGDSLPLDDNNE